MNVQTASEKTAKGSNRAFRRADRRSRHFRRRLRLSSHQAVPGHELRRARDAGDLWRHLDDPQISRHPLRQRPAHLRLQLQAVDRPADRDRRRNPDLHGPGDRRERPRAAHPLRPHDHVGALVEPGNLWTIEALARTPAKPFASPPASSGCARATIATAKATRRNGRAWRNSRARSSIRRTGRTISTTRTRRCVVIGSGATAATLLPTIADDCAHVTMLQRSPTYFRAGRNAIEIAESCASCRSTSTGSTRSCAGRSCSTRRRSRGARSTSRRSSRRSCWRGARASRAGLRRRDPLHAEIPSVAAAHRLHPDARPVQGHQVAARRPSSPTRSRRFTEKGVLLKSGKMLEADIIVTATGFNLCVMGDIEFTIDNKPLDFSETVTYRGMMFTGVPNLVWVFGYFRASWTLRVDLVGDFVCRLLDHMKTTGARKVAPALRPEDTNMQLAAVDRRGKLQPRLHACAACICCRSAATRPNGSTPRTTGPRRTSFRRSTSTTRRSCTSDAKLVARMERSEAASSDRTPATTPGFCLFGGNRVPAPACRSIAANRRPAWAGGGSRFQHREPSPVRGCART